MASRPKTPKAPAATPDTAQAAVAAPEPITSQAEGQPAEAGSAPTLPLTVVVKGPKGARRRAGRAFGPEPVSISIDELTEADLVALQSDPLLSVEIIDAPY